MRIDVHNHFLPNLDDGCRNVEESLDCLRMMVAHGYSKIFCTPHCGATEFCDLTTEEVEDAVKALRMDVEKAGIPIQLRPGGELRLTPDLPELMRQSGIPTYGHAGKFVVADIWEAEWPGWANRAVEWLLKQDLTVILAHPERMPPVREDPKFIRHLKSLGLLFQGNLGPIAGADAQDINELADKFLKEGRYFMLGTDGHRIAHLPQRLAGLKRAAEAVGQGAVDILTITNPAQLWV